MRKSRLILNRLYHLQQFLNEDGPNKWEIPPDNLEESMCVPEDADGDRRE
jgi:hypothetical protein